MEDYIYKKTFDNGMDTIVRDCPVGDVVFRTILTTDGEGIFEMTRLLRPIDPGTTFQDFPWEDIRKDDWILYLEVFKKEISRRTPIRTQSQLSTFWIQSYTDGSRLYYMYDLASKIDKLSLTNTDPSLILPGNLDFSSVATFPEISDDIVQKTIEEFFE